MPHSIDMLNNIIYFDMLIYNTDNMKKQKMLDPMKIPKKFIHHINYN
jgi:hypothetical protein